MRDIFPGTEEVPTSSPLFSKPYSGETLFLYLAVSESTIRKALVRDDKAIQKPVYYAIHSMNGPQIRYQMLHKLVLALFIISRKLKHYFQIFPITVLTEHPLRSVMKNSKAIRRISKWASELRSCRLKYEPRITVKGQVLADFILNSSQGS